MKSEQALFGERFRAALKSTGYPESPSELCRQLTKHGGEPTTPQAVSSWLRGKSVPRQRNMRALAKMLRMDPVALLFGSTESGKRVREPVAEFRVNAQDQHAVDAFLVLNIRKRKLVRELIELLSEYERKPDGFTRRPSSRDARPGGPLRPQASPRSRAMARQPMSWRWNSPRHEIPATSA